MAKTSKKVAERARLLEVADVGRWVLICKDEVSDDWHIAWAEPFGTKKGALSFASGNGWSKPYRAVRGRLTLDPVQ